jgi:hypothetical protein
VASSSEESAMEATVFLEQNGLPMNGDDYSKRVRDGLKNHQTIPD